MKKTALTLLAAVGMPLLAHAQTSSVTLHGLIDAGIEYARYSSSAGNSATQTSAGNPSGASSSALRISPGIQLDAGIGIGEIVGQAVRL